MVIVIDLSEYCQKPKGDLNPAIINFVPNVDYVN
jgi:hypothetical protein